MKYTYILLLLLSYNIVFSQEKNSSDTEIIIFDDEEKEEMESDENPYIGSIVFKTNPFSAFFGMQYLEVEKPLLDFLSIEAGVGLTFHNYISSLVTVEEYYDVVTNTCQSNNWPKNRDYCDNYNNYTYRSTDLGFTGMAAIKLYFGNDAPDGNYLSFNIQYFNKNYQVQQIDENYNAEKRVVNLFDDEIVNNIEYSIRAGWQTLHEPLVSDVFLGIGIRNSHQTRQDIGYSEKGLLQNGIQTFKKNNLILVGGFRIGIHTMKKKPKKVVNKGRKRKRK